MPVADEEDEGDRERRIALAAAKVWLAGKPPEVWLWLRRLQEASEDEYGILAWMETQPDLGDAVAVGLPASVAEHLPPGLRHYRDPATWDFFKAMNWADCPRPGSKAFAAWLEQPSQLDKMNYPDLFPETRAAKLERYAFAVLGLLAAAAGIYVLVVRFG